MFSGARDRVYWKQMAQTHINTLLNLFQANVRSTWPLKTPENLKLSDFLSVRIEREHWLEMG